MLVVEFLTYAKPPTAEIRQRHQQMLRSRGSEGKLLMSGKFMDETGGLVIWRVESAGDAEKFARDDPFFKEGFATFVLKEWSPSMDYTKAG